MKKNCIDINDNFINYCVHKEEQKGQEKHLKGYIFDSLVYRYQLARFSEADYEAKEKGASIQETRDIAIRDIMKFIKILNEAMGEHD